MAMFLLSVVGFGIIVSAAVLVGLYVVGRFLDKLD